MRFLNFKRINFLSSVALLLVLFMISSANATTYFQWNGSGADSVTGNKLTSTSASAIDMFDQSTMTITKFGAHEVAYKGGDLKSNTLFTQYAKNSTNPTVWEGLYVGMEDTGQTVGSFKEAKVTFPGIWKSGPIMWEKANSVDGRLYFTLFYKSSIDLYIWFEDLTNSTYTRIGGTPGSLAVYNQNSAANVLIMEETLLSNGVRILRGSVLFNNLNNNLRINASAKTGTSTGSMYFYGFNLCDDKRAGWENFIKNDAILGTEINTTDNWGTTNVTNNNGTLTFDATSADAIAQLPLDTEFISGETYLVRMEVVSQTHQHMLRLSNSSSGFPSTNTTVTSYSAGFKTLKVPCGTTGGRLRLVVSNASYPGTLVVRNISVKKYKENKRVISSRKETNLVWFGPADGTEKITDSDMEGSQAVWYSYGTPAVNVRSSEEAFSGTYSRKIQNVSEDGLRSSTFTTSTDDLCKVSFKVFPVDDVRTLALVVRSGDNSKWILSKAVNQYDLVAGQWNTIEYFYSETNGGTGAYAMVYDTGTNSNRYYIDDLSIKTTSDRTMVEAFPGMASAETSAKINVTWETYKSYTAGEAGVILNSGSMILGYTQDGHIYFSDGVTTSVAAYVNWGGGESIEIEVVYGRDPLLGTDKKKFKVVKGGTTYYSDKTSYVGNFNFDYWLMILNEETSSSVSEVKFSSVSLADWM